jgi:hypothetical protein
VNRSHARFESLEGAILLGEATAGERDEYAQHARGCSLCSGEAVPGELLATVAAGRDGVTWRPSVDRPILARVRDERMRRSRFAVGALGWAAACSIAVNVAFVTGFAGKVGDAFDFGAAPAAVASAPYGVRLPPETFAKIVRRALPKTVSTVASRHAPHRAAIAASAMRVPVRSERPADDVSVPDIFAGLDARGSSAVRSVAVETFPCDGFCGTQTSEPRP